MTEDSQAHDHPSLIKYGVRGTRWSDARTGCVHASTTTARQILVTMISWKPKETPYMNTHLPADLEQFVQAKVRSGRFSSSDDAMAAAVRLLRQQEEAEEARVLEGIR